MMKAHRTITSIVLICLSFLIFLNSTAQNSSFNFHKLGLQDGLHDGIVRCIGQDKYGYIWIGTVGALNRFDGKTVKHFTSIAGDTTSPYTSQPRTIHSDRKGRLWIGYETGLTEFNFHNSTFRRISLFKDLFVQKIVSLGDSVLYVATTRGLYRYNINTSSVFNYGQSELPQHEALKRNSVGDVILKNDSLFLATNKGFVILSIKTNAGLLVPVPVLNKTPIRTIAIDKDRNIWLGTFGEVKLVKLSVDLKKTEVYDRFLSSSVNTQPMNVMDILADSKNRIWVVTAIDGLLQYIDSNNSFT